MINQEELANFIKKIRKDYSLSQASLARILMVDKSLISHYENLTKMPSWENIIKLCEHFGYELKIVPKEKQYKKDIDFYYPKSYKSLCYMNHEERLDYVFVTQENDVLMNICNIDDEKVFNLIPLSAIKDILSEKLFALDALTLYFELNRMYPGAEKEMTEFIIHARHWLRNRDIISTEMFNKIKFIEVTVDYEPEGGGYDEGYFLFPYYSFLDENKKELDMSDISMDEIIKYPTLDKEFFGDIYYKLGFNIGKYLFEEAQQEDDECVIIPLYY